MAWPSKFAMRYSIDLAVLIIDDTFVAARILARKPYLML
jgi:hypothetical protein